MATFEDKSRRLIKLLTELYAQRVAASGKRRLSDNSFAKWMGVSPGSYNKWINGNGLPSLSNSVIMARHLTLPEQRELFEILEYPLVIDTINDPEARYIAGNWHLLRDMPVDRKQILDHMKELTGVDPDEYNHRLRGER